MEALQVGFSGLRTTRTSNEHIPVGCRRPTGRFWAQSFTGRPGRSAAAGADSAATPRACPDPDRQPAGTAAEARGQVPTAGVPTAGGANRRGCQPLGVPTAGGEAAPPKPGQAAEDSAWAAEGASRATEGASRAAEGASRAAEGASRAAGRRPHVQAPAASARCVDHPPRGELRQPVGRSAAPRAPPARGFAGLENCRRLWRRSEGNRLRSPRGRNASQEVCPRPLAVRESAADMGETMSRRLKLHWGGEAEMEERAFPNPFPDYEAAAASAGLAGAAEDAGCARLSPAADELSLPFQPDGKIVHNLVRRIQTKIKDLLQQMEEGLKTADPHDCSAYTGWTGIALLYLQLYRVTCDQTYLLRSLDYVKRTLRNLSGRRVTFLCGDAGPLAVGAVIYHKLKSDCESQECITKLLQLHRTVVCQESELPDELLYGRAGYLYALLYLNTEIGPGTVCESAIKEVVTAIIESGKNLAREERKSERCPLLYQWHRKQYVGAAHGMAGIYYMLMQPAAKVDQETLIEMVKPSIDYVRHKKFRSGNYPSSLSNETDRLVHWCHGASGVIHMLMQAYQIFKEEKYLKEAMECSDVIWQRGLLRKGYGICHGTSGNGYSFLSLYHLTQDKKYLYRACKFAEWCLDYGAHGCRIPDRPYSLFEGMAGAVHFLSDILVPETSRFPAFELGSLQRD